MSQAGRSPVVLTLLAPADRCNQRCPACVIDRISEPVREPYLSPADYARFVEQFVAADIPILSVSFQGFEVTLPSSWSYLESAFDVAKREGVPRDFVTNGMLLHKWTERVVALNPQRISVSLDGSDAETNDRLRGLSGAFETTLNSLRRFLRGASQLRENLAVVSTVYPGQNEDSLLAIPSLLRALRIPRWGIGWELDRVGDRLEGTTSRPRLLEVLQRLAASAIREGIEYHISDDFGFLEGVDTGLHVLRPLRPDLLLRLDPLGYIRSGEAIATTWKADPARRWDSTRDAPTVSGYFERAAGSAGTVD